MTVTSLVPSRAVTCRVITSACLPVCEGRSYTWWHSCGHLSIRLFAVSFTKHQKAFPRLKHYGVIMAEKQILQDLGSWLLGLFSRERSRWIWSWVGGECQGFRYSMAQRKKWAYSGMEISPGSLHSYEVRKQEARPVHWSSHGLSNIYSSLLKVIFRSNPSNTKTHVSNLRTQGCFSISAKLQRTLGCVTWRSHMAGRLCSGWQRCQENEGQSLGHSARFSSFLPVEGFRFFSQ